MARAEDLNDVSRPAAQVVCTLAEHHYFYGAAALTNSLARAGFAGVVAVGFRGDLPGWLKALKRDPLSGEYVVTDAVRLRLVEVDGRWHLNNCKPLFLEQVMLSLYPDATLVFYFDTDIVVTQPWADFERWAERGLLMVLDQSDSYMSPHHVYRQAWRDLAARRGRACREFAGYVNGGCIGVSRAHAAFTTVWRELMDQLARDGTDMREMKNLAGMPEFLRMDQDVLNAAIMATEFPVALLGPEAMGVFPWAGVVMLHALWRKKPWRRNYVLDALRGYPPDRAHRAYWDFVDGPIRPFGAAALSRKRAQLALGRVIGLLHSRSVRDL